MHSTWFSSAFLRFVKFCQIKEGDLISSGDPILQNGWIIWSPILCFNFRNLKEPNSSSFIRFQFILNDSAVLFSTFWNFVKIKRVVLISSGDPFLQNDWIIWSALLCFNFRNLKDPSSSSFIRFQCILHDSAVLFSSFWSFAKLKNEDLIPSEEPILQNGWIIWYSILYFNFWNLKDPNSLSFIRFQCILHDWEVLFSGFGNFLKLKRGFLISS